MLLIFFLDIECIKKKKKRKEQLAITYFVCSPDMVYLYSTMLPQDIYFFMIGILKI